MYVYIVAVYKQSGTFKSLYVNLKKKMYYQILTIPILTYFILTEVNISVL